jgi:hypothetical protein
MVRRGRILSVAAVGAALLLPATAAADTQLSVAPVGTLAQLDWASRATVTLDIQCNAGWQIDIYSVVVGQIRGTTEAGGHTWDERGPLCTGAPQAVPVDVFAVDELRLRPGRAFVTADVYVIEPTCDLGDWRVGMCPEETRHERAFLEQAPVRLRCAHRGSDPAEVRAVGGEAPRS